MNQYIFYYDEAGNDPKLSIKQAGKQNFYYNFYSCFVGFNDIKIKALERQYLKIESKYKSKKYYDVVELKSSCIKKYNKGLKSLKPKDIEFYNTFFDFLIKSKSKIIINIFSKIDYIVSQFLYKIKGLNNRKAVVTITNLIFLNRDKELEELILCSKPNFKKVISKLKSIIEQETKLNEDTPFYIDVLETALDVDLKVDVNRDYSKSFISIKKYIEEEKCEEPIIYIDKHRKTALAAEKYYKFGYVREANSTDTFGIRIADMLVGLISRIINEIDKKFINASSQNFNINFDKWLDINKETFVLYKNINKVLFKDPNNFSVVTSFFRNSLDIFRLFLEEIDNYKSYSKFKTAGVKKMVSNMLKKFCNLNSNLYEWVKSVDN